MGQLLWPVSHLQLGLAAGQAAWRLVQQVASAMQAPLQS